MGEPELIPAELIQSRILVIRGVRVLLDADLARLYGVPTKRLNEQVKRNAAKFPEDFCFQLTLDETEALKSKWVGLGPRGAANRSQNATGSQKHRDPRFLPYVFTEYGALQAANVLSSAAASEMSVHVVRAFARLRQLLVNHKALAAKLVAAIRQLAAPDGPRRRRKIGFHQC
jgi:ORF6N domain